jgi:hypothetical protein
MSSPTNSSGHFRLIAKRMSQGDHGYYIFRQQGTE